MLRIRPIPPFKPKTLEEVKIEQQNRWMQNMDNQGQNSTQ
jgi:hypothetical protein